MKEETRKCRGTEWSKAFDTFGYGKDSVSVSDLSVWGHCVGKRQKEYAIYLFFSPLSPGPHPLFRDSYHSAPEVWDIHPIPGPVDSLLLQHRQSGTGLLPNYFTIRNYLPAPKACSAKFHMHLAYLNKFYDSEWLCTSEKTVGSRVQFVLKTPTGHITSPYIPQNTNRIIRLLICMVPFQRAHINTTHMQVF